MTAEREKQSVFLVLVSELAVLRFHGILNVRNF